MASSVFWVEPSTMIPTCPPAHRVGPHSADRLRVSSRFAGTLARAEAVAEAAPPWPFDAFGDIRRQGVRGVRQA